MCDTASQYINKPVNHAAVMVPAYFNDAQRQATKGCRSNHWSRGSSCHQQT
ncbi:hypothetical protein F5887DRAFT_985311, partial [Amanita rubescens]